MTVSLDDQIKAVKRELGYRRHVYARRVSENKMTQITADREIAAMEAVQATLQLMSDAATEGGEAKAALMNFLDDQAPKQGGLF